MPQVQSARKYSYQMDSLRFIAMLSIFCNHCIFFKDNVVTADLFERYYHYGGIGVEFFILLSGFMAAYTFNPEQDAKHYIKKRALRLFPVHWFCLILYFPFVFSSLDGILHKIVSLLFTVSLFQSVSDITWRKFNAASWTISTLWIMYIVTPLLLSSIRKIKDTWLFLGLIASVIIGFILNYIFYDDYVWFFYISPFYRLITYSQGMVLALLLPYFDDLYQSCSQKLKSIFEVSVVIAFIVELIMVSPYSHYGYNYTFVFLIMLIVFFSGGGILSVALSNKWLVRMSKICLSFYLVHYWICTKFTHAFMKYFALTPTEYNIWIVFFIDLFLSFVLASLIYCYIEKKLTNWLGNAFLKH